MKSILLMLLLAGDGGTPDAEHEHCWHYSTLQHAMPCHTDETCCRCGADRCVHNDHCWLGEIPGHGPFAPGTIPLLVVDGGFAR